MQDAQTFYLKKDVIKYFKLCLGHLLSLYSFHFLCSNIFMNFQAEQYLLHF